MATDTAPSPNFSGIDFNPDFFSSSTSLTLAEADALYLNKSTPDTANVLETFTVGISANAIQGTTANITSVSSDNIDSLATTLNLGGTNCSTGTINLGASQTTGTLNIGGSGRTTGGINIGASSVGATPIVIGTSSVGSTTTINGSTVAITTKLTSPVIDSSSATTSMTIGSNLTGANLSIGGAQTGAIGLGGSQTTGTLNIGTSSARTTGGGGGGINIGTAAIGAIPIVIGTTGQSTTSLRGTSVDVVTKMTSPVYDSTGSGTSMSVGGNITTASITIGGALSTGSITMGGVQTTGDINIGNSNATGDIYIGNGTNSTTGANTGICSINKIQVGNTTTGSGVGTGTPFRCVIIERSVGSTSSATGTITIPGAPSGAGNPLVFTSLNATTTSNPYFLNVIPTGTNTFTYYKTFYNRSGTTFSNAIAAATSETFNYIAIWL